MYNAMKKLISRMFYATIQEAQEKLDIFYAMGRLTSAQYTELSNLVNEIYND